MIRNLKVLGLALVAAFALSAVVASAASAHFTSGADSTTLTATALNEQVFVTHGTPGENTEVKCTQVSVTGGPFGTDETELTVHPTYGGTCTITVEGVGSGLTAEVKSNGCNYIFTTTLTNNIHIECGANESIEVKAFILGKFRNCLDVHAQTPTTALVDYFNHTNPATGKMDVEIESTVDGITYEKTGSCAFGTTEGNDAEYNGNVTVTCDEEGTNTPVDCTKS
jgi:hypothetical protein